jgi:hypothetical protein
MKNSKRWFEYSYPVATNGRKMKVEMEYPGIAFVDGNLKGKIYGSY